jgi:hypothetical protein
MAPAAAAAIDPSVDPAATPAAPAAPAVTDPKAPVVDPAKPKESTSILDVPDDDKVTPGDWPTNWRELYAGEDQKRLKALSRYASPKAALDAMLSAQDKIRSGELLKKPGKDASPEELKAWRDHQGIPEKAEDYLTKLPNGLVIGEDDKELISSFATELHGLDAPPAIVHKAIDWYYKTIEQQRQDEYEVDREARQQTEDALRADFGEEYRRNINIMNGVIQAMPGEAGKLLATARSADGVQLLNHPDVIRGLVDWARQLNPVATIIPGATNPGALGDRIAQIEKVMREDINAYWKDEPMKKEYAELLAARERMSSKE